MGQAVSGAVSGRAYNDAEVRAAIGLVAAQADLGPHRATYVAAEWDRRRSTIAGVGLLSAVLVVLLGIASGTAIVVIVGCTGTLLLGGLLLCDLLLRGYLHSRNGRVRMDLYERGLVALVRGAPRVVRYDSTVLRRSIAEHASNPAPHQISHRYTVTDTLGDPIVLRHTIAEPDEWGPAIDAFVTAAQLPEATRTLGSGAQLDFEHFWLTRTEIGAGGRAVPWSEVAEIAVRKGWVSVHLAGQARVLASIPVSLVPNFTIFWQLAERMRTEANGVNSASR
ncbi:DUF6585 family protein [Nocardia brasiliensis]|uniref:DUF6585 family protein n=1 Tax=Nocardia brasiliensis TaxID=37326 RepID=UPI00114D2CC1|nr:DUF6585 family protein [Nocardia brasiliensis]